MFTQPDLFLEDMRLIDLVVLEVVEIHWAEDSRNAKVDWFYQGLSGILLYS